MLLFLPFFQVMPKMAGLKGDKVKPLTLNSEKIKFFETFLQRVVISVVFKVNSNQKSYFDTTSINRSLQAE